MKFAARHAGQRVVMYCTAWKVMIRSLARLAESNAHGSERKPSHFATGTRICPRCDGRGMVGEGRGLNVRELWCEVCRGDGVVPLEPDEIEDDGD